MTQKYEVWLADLDPQYGTEPGKIRPVVIVQSNLINGKIKSTMVCPITTKILSRTNVMRLRLASGAAGLDQESEILISQVRAIDNLRLVKKLGTISTANRQLLDENLKIVLDLG
ncbi:MAG: type II toxin-antitoxin system PemK/MazF family toxin [Saprospiraceae bacterium]|nr:MAG: type II toxin-antitoxin system PemK/MazF family toxin [Saprospiraceae bacterium]